MKAVNRGPLSGLVAILAALIALLTFAAVSARADANCSGDMWTNPNGGAWGVGSNWSTGSAPGTNDVACITLAGTYTVTLGPYTPSGANASVQGGDTVAGLTVGGGSSGTQTLDIVGTSYSKGGENQADINLAVQGPASIAANGALTLDAQSATAEFNDATLANAGTISAQSESSSFTTKLGGTITNTGTISVNTGTFVLPSADEGGTGSTGGFSLNNTGTVAVASGAEVLIALGTGVGTSSFTQNGTINNNGTIVAQANGASLTWNQNGGSMTGNAIQLQNGTLLNDSAGSGSFIYTNDGGGIKGTVPAGQTVTFQGDSYITSSNEGSNTDSFDLQGATLTNDGTIDLDATSNGPGNPTGATSELTDGALQNNATLNLQVDDSAFIDDLEIGLTNAHGANVNLISGKTQLTNGGTFTNDGTVTIAPNAVLDEFANPFLTGAESFNNATDGTIVPQISGASTYGTVDLAGDSKVSLAGTLSPQLTGGYTPATGTEFAVLPIQGATVTGTFGSVSNGFNADYTQETASSPYVGAIYGPAPTTSVPTTTTPTTTTPPTHKPPAATGKPTVSSVKTSNEKVLVSLACTVKTGCVKTRVTVSIVERIRNKKIVGIGATKAPRTINRTVTIATSTVTLKGGQKKTVTLTISKTAKTLLAKYHRFTATVKVATSTKTLKSTTIRLSQTKPAKKKVVAKQK